MMKRNLLIIGLAALLGACGFQLRGTGTTEFAIKELAVSARNAYGDTVKQVTQVLENNGVNVHPGAAYSLYLSDEKESRRTVSTTSAARGAEYELSLVLDYQIRGEKNLQLLKNRLEVQNYYLLDNNNLTGSDQEMDQVRQEMRRELVQQLAQRLQLLTPAQLDTLQQTAEAKAKAEADALEAARQREAQQPQQSPLQLPIQ